MENQSEHILPLNSKIKEFVIESILGEGGFGITYLANDTKLHRKVAIKEYFPSDISFRARDSVSINPKTSSDDNYRFGLNKFLEEARTLAQFSHPNIVRVTRFVEANNTAYLIMDYEQGEDLNDYLKRTDFKGNMPETELKSYLVPILNGLHAVHDKGLLHRDVKPGNIYLRKDAEPMLIDFGAARYALGEHSKSMSAIISMGYAPPEQYSSKGKQNQASDIYAWGATAYQLITGKAPIESPDRLNAIFEEGKDLLIPISQTHQGKYSKELLLTIDKCIEVSNKNRPQSAQEVIDMLEGNAVIKQTVKVNPNERFKSSHSDSGTKYVKDEERFTAERIIPAQAGISSSNRVLKKKNNLLKYSIIFIALAALATGSYFGYDYYQTQQLRLAEEQAWSHAELGNSIASYQTYLDEYAKGKNQSQANHKIKQLKVELSILITQAQKLLVKLGYQIPTDGRLDALTEAAIKDFEKKQNILITGKTDQVLINNLEKAYKNKDPVDWFFAQGDIQLLQAYANNYPDGKYINQVDNKIANIRQAQQALEDEKKRLDKLSKEERVRKQKDLKAEEQLITSIQTEFQRLKVTSQSVKGQFDNGTKILIKTYQKLKKYNATGHVTQKLLTQLKAETKWPGKLPGETFKDCSNCPGMVVIPSGSFQMGSNISANEKPIHTVNINQFSMSQTEVTKGQFGSFVKSTDYKTEAESGGGCRIYDVGWQKKSDVNWRNAFLNQTGESPVVCVSWNDTKEYIKWLKNKTGMNYRLPSESEWEYSVRAGSSTKYSWGDSINCNQARYTYDRAVCSKQKPKSTYPVKSFVANSFGLYDMNGNVLEWIQDNWHFNYKGAPIDGSVWIGGYSSNRMLRGGSWIDHAANWHSAKRFYYAPSYLSFTVGFRVAKDE